MTDFYTVIVQKLTCSACRPRLLFACFNCQSLLFPLIGNANYTFYSSIHLLNVENKAYLSEFFIGYFT